jgi:hypothetical protein
MMKRLSVLPLLALLGGLLAWSASAQQYKWVDQNGRTQYGDQPPPGVKATPLRPPPAGSAAPAAQKPAGKAPSGADKDADQKKQAAAAQDAEAKKANCAAAQTNMQTLETGRVRRPDPKTGELVYMEDSQLADAKEQARRSIAEWCK